MSAPAGRSSRPKSLVAGYMPEVDILNGVSTMSVGEGEVVTVVGPNGAGKSTLLKAIVGLLRPQARPHHPQGSEVAGLRPNEIARRGLGYVPQRENVFESDVGRGESRDRSDGLRSDDLDLWARACSRHVRAVPAPAERRRQAAGNLSGGERQMLAMARAADARSRRSCCSMSRRPASRRASFKPCSSRSLADQSLRASHPQRGSRPIPSTLTSRLARGIRLRPDDPLYAWRPSSPPDRSCRRLRHRGAARPLAATVELRSTIAEAACRAPCGPEPASSSSAARLATAEARVFDEKRRVHRQRARRLPDL